LCPAPLSCPLFPPSALEPVVSEPLEDLLREHAELEAELADPAIHADAGRARKLGRRYAELAPVVELARRITEATADLEVAKEYAREDASFAGEVDALTTLLDELNADLRRQLLPKDPNDDKDVSFAVKARPGGTPPWSKLKYEGGVHRVQRVPATESQGRIHTSAAGVLVLPEAEEVEVDIDPNDLRIDIFRSSGPGGQSVNTTDSAVRITHVPTGIVVSCQNEKSQLQNKEAAMRVLRARMLAAAQESANAEASAARLSQVRTVDRSERVRTYNFPENRISDHRVGFKAYNLDQVLDGDLDAVVQALVDADTAAALSGDDN